MRRRVLAIVGAALVLGGGVLWLAVRGLKTEKAQPGPPQKPPAYDGYWLQAAKNIKDVNAEDTQERLAVLEAVGECAFLPETSYSLSRKLSAYYAANPSQRGLNVLEAWKKLPERP